MRPVEELVGVLNTLLTPEVRKGRDVLSVANGATILDHLKAKGLILAPEIATQDMLDAWMRQHSPGEKPTMQQRYGRMMRKRPK